LSSKKRQNIAYYLYYLFAGLSISAITLSLIGYLGRLNRYFEFASGYKLQLLLVALCALVYFLLTSKKFWIAINLGCLLLNLAVILPWYFHPPVIINPEQYQPLKVLSYNVLWSNKEYDRAMQRGLGGFPHERLHQEAIALVNQEQPDLAIFQEAVPHWHQGLNPLQSDYPHHIRATKLEIEIYSKLPLPQPEIKLYGTYRGLVIVELQIGDHSIKFIATHAYPQLYFGHQGWQIRNQHLEVGIGEYVANLNQPAIVLGDLNVSMWSPFYHSMIQSSGLSNARQGLGILPTQSTIAPQFAALSAAF